MADRVGDVPAAPSADAREEALQRIIEHGYAGLLCCAHATLCASAGNAVGIAEHALRAPASGEGA